MSYRYDREHEFEAAENRAMRRSSGRKQKHSTKKALAAAGALLLTGAFVTGTVAGSLHANFAAAEEAESAEVNETVDEEVYTGSFTQTAIPESVQPDSVLPDLSAVVESASASLVSITNTIEITQTSGGNGFDNYFYNFFSSPYGGNGQQQEPTVREAPAYGSGVIIGEDDDELLILTNNHVAVYDESGSSYFYSFSASTKELEVTFVDGTSLKAELKGANKKADLAVIAVKLDELSEETKNAIRVATIGSSDEVKVGQGVIAIGNALGRGQTATIGYVSALNREVTTEDGITRTLMQVDAAINEGNSGGGLFNSKGELIGINSAKNTGVGVEGFGFAIPISNVRELITKLETSEPREALASDEHGYVGLNGQDVPAALVANYGFPAGAQIIAISENSPAEEAGLQINDIITAVNGEDVTSYDELRAEFSYYAPGETVTLTVYRSTGTELTEMDIDVTLVSREDLMK